jgi:integrase
MRRTATGHLRKATLASGERSWRAQIRLPDGRRRQRSLGKVWDKRSSPPSGYLTRTQAEARLNAILAGNDPSLPLQVNAADELTFGTVCNQFLEWKEKECCLRTSTLADYRQEIGHFLEFFGEATRLAEIDVESIRRWKEDQLSSGRLAARTFNKRRTILLGVFNRAVDEHGLESNPVSLVPKQPEKSSGELKALSADEIELLATHAASEEDAAFFRVAAHTGLRLGEMRELRWKHIDWHKRFIYVRGSFVSGTVGPPKSGKVRSVPISDQAARSLEQLSRRTYWTDGDDLVFCNQVGGRIEDSALRRRFKAALVRAALPDIRLHDLRHTFGTIAVQLLSLPDLQAYMGHADVHTTMRYIHHQPRTEDAQKLTEAFRTSFEQEVGSISGAPQETALGATEENSAPVIEIRSGPGRTRTSDLRIMSPLL